MTRIPETRHETKHTPVPWKAESNDGHLNVWGGHGASLYVADCGPASNTYSEGNARLIAAAPDMLTALRESVKQLAAIERNGMPTDWQAWRDDLNAVIAKAEGRS